MHIQLPFAWDEAREICKEVKPIKKVKRVLGAAVVNTGEMAVGGSRSTASVSAVTQKITENL